VITASTARAKFSENAADFLLYQAMCSKTRRVLVSLSARAQHITEVIDYNLEHFFHIEHSV